MKTLLLLFLSLSVSAIAGVILPHAENFKVTGTVDSFHWAPDHYQDQFQYDILYYIPEALKDKSQIKTLIFLHGGGGSTVTRDGSLKTAQNYMERDLKKLADDLQMAVIVPSGTGLNWGGHTVSMIRGLNHLIRKELSIDHNNIGLSGHSMGGMGIGRSFPFLADEFAYFLPMASGIDPIIQTEHHLNKAFNVPYVHLQGLRDHFTAFIKRCHEQMMRTFALEQHYGEASKLEIIYYDGNHNSDYNLFKKSVARLQKSPRNLYQSKLYGTLYFNNNLYTENNITFHQNSSARYFWVELIETISDKPVRMDFTATINNNVVHFQHQKKPSEIKRIRIRLSDKLLNKNLPITFYVNGKLLLTLPKMRYKVLRGKIDPAYEFNDSIDLVWN